MKPLVRDAFRYTPFFCEENIWWLARRLVDAGVEPARLDVLLFTNPDKSIVLHKQRAAEQGMPVVWDYHVVLEARLGDGHWVLDFDTRLLFPIDRATYLRETFPRQVDLPARYRTWVRTIPAHDYLARFFSDRSHMRAVLPEAEFPDYPIIRPAAGVDPIALADYCDVHRVLDDGSRLQPIDDLTAA